MTYSPTEDPTQALLDMLTDNEELANMDERLAAMIAQIVEAAAKSQNAAGSNEQKVGDLYGVGMDIERLNAGAPVLAVDIPSGLGADSGAASLSVRAAHTLSLLALKPGLFTAGGRDAAGQVWLDDLAVDAAHERATAWLSAICGGSSASRFSSVRACSTSPDSTPSTPASCCRRTCPTRCPRISATTGTSSG